MASSLRIVRSCRRAAACSALFVASLVPGCSGDDAPELGTVVGTVTLDGRPLSDAAIVFQPDEGSISIGRTDQSGRYELRYSFEQLGAVPGRHKVRITTADDSGEEPVPEQVPVKYNHLTELAEEVKPGENTIDFDLKSEGLVVQPHETEKLERLQYQAGRK